MQQTQDASTSTTSTQQTTPSTDPISRSDFKPSLAAKLKAPFQKKEKETPPKLKQAIADMEAKREERLAEMEAQGIDTSKVRGKNKDMRSESAVAALGNAVTWFAGAG